MDSGHASEQQQQYIRKESSCLLKTKTDNFKTHWAVLDGNEIYCFRHQADTQPRVMHSLAGTFL